MSRWTRGAVACGVVLLAATACADAPVELDNPNLDDADRATCVALVDDLPETLAGEERRLVAPAAAPGAAWGDPPIVLRCGADLAEPDADVECLEANGVDWFVTTADDEDPEADATVTAAGYRPSLTVAIPGDHQPEGVASVTAALAPSSPSTSSPASSASRTPRAQRSPVSRARASRTSRSTRVG